MICPEPQAFKVRHAYFDSPNFAKSFGVREVDMDDELMERSDDSGELQWQVKSASAPTHSFKKSAPYQTQ